jgi:FAD/FMN-containing dehydrogenase
VANEYSALDNFPLKPSIALTMGSISTLCNYVSRGFSGTATKYGIHSENIVNMTWILPDGEIVKFGPGSFPNVGDVPIQFGPGPDVSGMFISADGMMGICTEITIKLFPEQQCERSYYGIPRSWEGPPALLEIIELFYRNSQENQALGHLKMCPVDSLVFMPEDLGLDPADILRMVPEHSVVAFMAGMNDEEMDIREAIMKEISDECNVELSSIDTLSQMYGISMSPNALKKIYNGGKFMKPKGSFQWIAGYYKLDRIPELMGDFMKIVDRFWRSSDPRVSPKMALAGSTHMQGPLPFGRCTTVEFDFWWDPGNPEEVKRAILTLKHMGEMMMDHGMIFAKNLVGTYELLPRLGVYYDLVCRAKEAMDPLNIMHPDIMPVGPNFYRERAA